MIPDSWTNKIPIKIDEDKVTDPNDKLMNLYSSQANAKVIKKK